MKQLFLLTLAVCLTACGGGPVRIDPATNSNANSNSNERVESMIEHSGEPRSATPMPTVDPSAPKTKWAQSGDPIDTASLDKQIKTAQTRAEKSPNDAEAQKALADAYFARASELTGARQYASALGDYRKALKYDPSNQEARTWVGRIIAIYDGLNKEAPKEGEEPPPLSFKKENTK